MQCQPLVVHDQNSHGQGNTHAPEHVRGDERAERMLRIGKHFRDFGTRAGGDDRGGNGEQLRCGDAV